MTDVLGLSLEWEHSTVSLLLKAPDENDGIDTARLDVRHTSGDMFSDLADEHASLTGRSDGDFLDAWLTHNESGFAVLPIVFVRTHPSILITIYKHII